MSRSLLLGGALVLAIVVVAEAGRGGGAPPAELLVGVLSHQAVRECHARFRERWVQPHHEVGFVWIKPGPEVAPEKFRGRLVVVEGVPSSRPPIKGRSTGQCMAMQMRSDWVQGVNGIRVRRTGQPALSAFAARRIRPFVGLTLRRSGDNVDVRFKNTLGRDLKQVTLRVHYEGCYGKPGAPHTDHLFGSVAAGRTVKARFPLLLEKKMHARGRRLHRAVSLQIMSRTPSVHFAVDWPLVKGQPALATRCPRRP